MPESQELSMVRLADCGTLLTGGTPSRSEPLFWGGSVPWISAKSLKRFDVFDSDERLTDAGAATETMVPTGTVLFVVRGMSLANELRVGVTQRPVTFNQDLRGLVPREGIDGRYLGRFLEASGNRILTLVDEASHGTKRLTSDRFENIEVPVPPLAEQRRIVCVLDRAEELRARRRTALAQLDTLTNAIFLDLFGNPGTNPKAWPERTIADLCEVKGGKRLPKGEEYSSTQTPFRYIRVTDLRAGVVDERALVYLKPDVQARIARYIVHTGDVIISIAGSIGLVAPVPPSLDGANLTENAAKLVPLERNSYNPGFLSAILQTPFAQNQIVSHIGQVTISKLALFRIEKLRLPMPPLALQHEFAHRVAAVEKLKTAHRASLAEFDALFASLQHRAFRGEL